MSPSPKIYVALPSFKNEEACQILEDLGEVTFRSSYPRPSEAELVELAKEFDVLVIGIKEAMTREVYDQSQNLKVIGSMSTGVDHIDQSFLKSGDITVTNCAGSNASSVAEHSLALALMLMKRVDSVLVRDNGDSGRDDTVLSNIRDLRGMHVGLVGAGSISQWMMRLLSPFEPTISCWTRNPEKYRDVFDQYKVQATDLESVFQNSSFVSIHVPLTESLRGFVTREHLELLGGEGIIVNTARAELMDCGAAFELVLSDRLGGVAIDDFPEKLGVAIPRHPSVLVTPHTAISRDAVERMEVDTARNVARALKERR